MPQVPPTRWYLDSVNWSAVTAWATGAKSAGVLVRQTAPAVGAERVFVCIVAGSSGAGEPAWTTTKGSKTTDNTVTWQECTGQPGVNGDTVNSPTWLQNKNVAVSLGLIIFDSVTSSLQIVSTAGTTGNGAQPGFSATAGVTTGDNTVTWTSLGLASGFGKFAAPHARAVNSIAVNWAAATDWIFTASSHAETTAGSIAPVGQSTSYLLNLFISVNKAGNVPPQEADYQAGASITSTGATVAINCQGAAWFGFTFVANTTVSLGGTQRSYLYMKDCKFSVSTRSNALDLFDVTGVTRGKTILENCTVKFGNVGNKITNSGGACLLEIINCSAQPFVDGTGVIPTVLFQHNAISGGAYIRGLDLSNVNTTLFTPAPSATAALLFANCKLNGSVTPYTTPVTVTAMILNNCDSSVSYRNERHELCGDLTTETSITLVGGALDYGGQLVSHKMVSNVNANPYNPMAGEPIFQECLFTSGTRTVTIEIVSSQTLKNGDIWMDLEYEGDGASPLSSFANCWLSNPLSTPTALPLSPNLWNALPATPVTQQLQVSFTPRAPGNVIARVYLGKASTTVYVDPALVIA